MLPLRLNTIFSPCCLSASSCGTVSPPQIRPLRSGDISPDLFKSSAAPLPDTQLLSFGGEAALVAALRHSVSKGQEVTEDERGSEWHSPRPQRRPQPRRGPAPTTNVCEGEQMQGGLQSHKLSVRGHVRNVEGPRF